jgi:hypothetical protein
MWHEMETMKEDEDLLSLTLEARLSLFHSPKGLPKKIYSGWFGDFSENSVSVMWI